MNTAHREERQKLKVGQEKRWANETKARSERLNKGVRGLFDRLSGKAKSIRQQNELEATKSAKRDQKQRDFMVVEQMKERRALQREFQKLRRCHADERSPLAANIKNILNRSESIQRPNRSRDQSLDLSI